MSRSARRLTLVESVVSEAKRFGHGSPHPAHLALVLAREAPDVFKLSFGLDTEQRLVAALFRSAPDPKGADVLSLIETSESDERAALLEALMPYVAELVGRIVVPAVPERVAWQPRPAATDVPQVWRAGDFVLDRYEVLGIAGEGGMGTVYRVRHLLWNVELAVKSPRPGYFQSEEAMAAF